MTFMAKVNDEGLQIETACTLIEMLASITTIIRALYDRFDSQMAKSLFRAGIEMMVKDKLCFADDLEVQKLCNKWNRILEEAEDSSKEKKPLFEVNDKMAEFLRELEDKINGKAE